MYKCSPYADWRQSCSSDSDCGFNEFCESYLFGGQCRTLMSDGSLCIRCVRRKETAILLPKAKLPS